MDLAVVFGVVGHSLTCWETGDRQLWIWLLFWCGWAFSDLVGDS